MLSVKLVNYEAGQTKVEPATMFIVEDANGNPILLVCEHQPGVTTVVTAKDPAFEKSLKAFGFDKTVYNTPIVLPASSADYRRLNL